MSKKSGRAGHSQAPEGERVAGSGEWGAITSGEHEIPVELIRESAENARKTFSVESIESLAESIRDQGQVLPVSVYPVSGSGERFELFDGARRFRAMKKIEGARTIRAVVCSVQDAADAHRRMMVTHVQREDINPVELGAAWRREMELGKWPSVREMAEAFGKAGHEGTITGQMNLGRCISEVAAAISEGKLPASHGILISREEPDDQARAFAACYETETVTIGLFPETALKLISEKALRSWIQTHLREPKTDEADAKKIAEKRVEAEARGDGERALEREGERLAGDGGDEDGELDDGESPVEGMSAAELKKCQDRAAEANAGNASQARMKAAEDDAAERSLRFGRLKKLTACSFAPTSGLVRVMLRGLVRVTPEEALGQAAECLAAMRGERAEDAREPMYYFESVADKDLTMAFALVVAAVETCDPEVTLWLLPALESMAVKTKKSKAAEKGKSKVASPKSKVMAKKKKRAA